MKTTVEIKLTSKNSGKTYNIVVDFLKNTYFCIELNENLNVNDLSANFPEYYQIATQALRDANIGESIELEKYVTNYGAGYKANSNGIELKDNIIEAFFNMPAATGKYIVTSEKIRNIVREETDKKDKLFEKNAKLSQEFDY